MSHHTDAGNAGIYGSGIVGAGTTAMTWAEVINANAMLIGILLTVVSLLVGIVFKVLQVRQTERHHQEELRAHKE